MLKYIRIDLIAKVNERMLIMKALTVLLEVIFLLCFVGAISRHFGIERVEDFTFVFYGVGAVCFISSTILRNYLKKKEQLAN